MEGETSPRDTPSGRHSSSVAAPIALVGVPLPLTALLTSQTNLSMKEGMLIGLISGVEMRPRRDHLPEHVPDLSPH